VLIADLPVTIIETEGKFIFLCLCREKMGVVFKDEPAVRQILFDDRHSILFSQQTFENIPVFLQREIDRPDLDIIQPFLLIHISRPAVRVAIEFVRSPLDLLLTEQTDPFYFWNGTHSYSVISHSFSRVNTLLHAYILIYKSILIFSIFPVLIFDPVIENRFYQRKNK